MASGKTHDLSGLVTLPVALIGSIVYIQEPVASTLFVVSYAVGFSHLSPDIDTKSVVFKRWSILKHIWKPYQRLFPHRGSFFNRNPFTHAPILGTSIRLLYITFWILLTSLILKNALDINWEFPSDEQVHKQIFWIFGGLEISAMVHLILDIIYTKTKHKKIA